MNKRISTMMAVFLTVGSMFSSMMATDATVVSAGDLVNGKKYYLVADIDDGGALNSGDLAMGFTGTTTVSAVGTDIADGALSGLSSAALTSQWQVEITKDGSVTYYRFKNVASGAYLSFAPASTGTLVTERVDANDFETNESRFILNTGKLQSATSNAGGGVDYNQLLVAGSAFTLVQTANAKGILFVEIPEESQAPADIVTANGVKFNLNFPEGVSLVGNEFSGLTPATVSGLATALNTSGDEFYFMVSGTPNTAATTSAAAAFTAQANFNNATFVVLDVNAYANLEGTDYAAGEGYKFKVVKGSEIIAAAAAGDKNKIAPANAKFLAATQPNQEGLILTLSAPLLPVSQKDATLEAKSAVRVTTIKANDKDFVSVKAADATTAWATITPGQGTLVNVKDLVKGKMIVNVLVANASGEFKLALGLNASGAISATLKNDDASLAYPAGQWLVSAVADANTVTLTNREITTVKEAGITLYKVAGKDNEYTVSGGTALTGTAATIKLVTLNDVSMYNGYLNMSAKEMSDYVYKLKTEFGPFKNDVYLANKYNATNLTNDVIPTQDADEALTWSFAKFTDVKDFVTDTIFVETEYGYYDADGKYATANDSIAMFAYTLNNSLGYLNYASTKYTSKALASGENARANADKFVLKEVGTGKFIIGASTTSPSTIEVPTWTGSIYLNVATDGASIAKGAASAASVFVIEQVAPATSFEPATKNVSFASVAGDGYIGVDKDDNGVVSFIGSELKSTTIADYTCWIDSVDAKAVVPFFYVTNHGKMMYNAADSVKKYAGKDEQKPYVFAGSTRVKFQEAVREGIDSLVLAKTDTISGDKVKAFRFNIIENEDGDYIIKSGANYVQNLNGSLVMTSNPAQALALVVKNEESPVANEGITTSAVKVTTIEGQVIIAGAQGKTVTISNVLGQTIASTVLSSDNVTISAPQGVVVVAVEGEAAVKAIVK